MAFEMHIQQRERNLKGEGELLCKFHWEYPEYEG